MSIRIYSHGGAGEVTGSKHFLDTGKTVVMIDCGAFQGKRAEADEKNREWGFNPRNLDAVVLTHAHFDHCGLLPLLPKKGYPGNIYSTAATRDLASIVMLDSARIQARDAQYLKKQAKKKNQEFSWEPLYTEKDAINATNHFVTVSYQRPLYLSSEVEVSFYDAGHILGSGLAYFTIRKESGETLNLAFSGDLGRKNKPIIRDPAMIPNVDYLVLESTYGDRLHEPAKDIMKILSAVVNDTVARNGKIIIPAFAIGRTQEIIFYLHLLADEKKIPEIPIYVDSPMSTNATSIFRVHPECYDEEINRAFIDHHSNPFGFNTLKYIESVDESKELNRFQGSAIIISSSGMCEAGRIQHHLLHTLDDSRNTILLVGYMAENTLGRKIKDRHPRIRILGEEVEVKAQVAEINALSAHADYMEAWEYVSGLDLKQLKKIFLVHGEGEALTRFKTLLLSKGVAAVEIVQYGKTYELA
ncbi:MAG: MBL fold metallo-hydrolase [Spirochaetota bacterium]